MTDTTLSSVLKNKACRAAEEKDAIFFSEISEDPMH